MAGDVEILNLLPIAAVEAAKVSCLIRGSIHNFLNQSGFPLVRCYEEIALNQEFSEESLNTIEIRDDELHELLERLAATDAMFRDPVTTVRDVAEVTEASPQLIARILSDIRGPGVVERIDGRLDNHDARLTALERQRLSAAVPPQRFVTPPPVSTVKVLPRKEFPIAPTRSRASDADWQRYREWLAVERSRQNSELGQFATKEIMTVAGVILAVIIIMCLIASANGSGQSWRSNSGQPTQFTTKTLPDGSTVMVPRGMSGY